MTAGQIIIILVCAGLGFGIVNNLINSARKPSQPQAPPEDDAP